MVRGLHSEHDGIEAEEELTLVTPSEEEGGREGAGALLSGGQSRRFMRIQAVHSSRRARVALRLRSC